MNFFEIRTIILFSGFISVCLFICMLYIYRSRKTYPGFRQWTIAFMLNFVGDSLFSVRDALPVFFTVILANLLLLIFFLLICRGLTAFVGDRYNYWIDIPILFVFLATFTHFSYFSPNVNARIVVISLLAMVVCVRCILIFRRKFSAVLAGRNHLLTATFGFLAAGLFLRAILTTLLEESITDFMSAGTAHGVYLIAATTGHIFIAIGLIVINAQRLEQDLIFANREINTLKGFLPICANCKKIRDDKGYWKQVEDYIQEHSEAQFSHGICPECAELLYPGFKPT